jgi:hypothetical protein
MKKNKIAIFAMIGTLFLLVGCAVLVNVYSSWGTVRINYLEPGMDGEVEVILPSEVYAGGFNFDNVSIQIEATKTMLGKRTVQIYASTRNGTNSTVGEDDLTDYLIGEIVFTLNSTDGEITSSQLSSILQDAIDNNRAKLTLGAKLTSQDTGYVDVDMRLVISGYRPLF